MYVNNYQLSFRYHIGTLAFGSLIIAICRIIRLVLEYIDHKLKKYDNEITRAIMCCLKCFFWCLEKFLKFINKNAYIMCAIHGKNFCASAKDAFGLLMRNILRVFVLDKVSYSKLCCFSNSNKYRWCFLGYRFSFLPKQTSSCRWSWMYSICNFCVGCWRYL